MPIEMGVGFSSHADVLSAGTQAAEQAVSHLAGKRPDLTLVFSSIRFADPRLLKGIRSVTSNAPLIGCTDAGGIMASGPIRRSVTVIGLIAKGGYFMTGLGRHMAREGQQAGEMLGRAFTPKSVRDAKALLMFPDGLTSSGSAVLTGVQKVIGEGISIAGGSAADDFYFQRTFQFFNDEILTDSVPGALFCGDLSVGFGARHGWIPLGQPRRVTRVSGHIIHQLDKRPAISIYEDYLGLKREELLEESLAHTSITYPLGASLEGQTEYVLRDAIRMGKAGSLICTGEIPRGTSVRIMIGGYESALEAAQQAAYEAMEHIGRSRLKGALVFCGVGRQKMLGSEFQGEIDVIRDALGGSGVRIGGFYSYGELAPVNLESRSQKRVQNMFHNESVVVMTLG